MTHHEFFEAMMLFCFSVSWYWSIARLLQTGVAHGRSRFFLVMNCAGYTLGISSKILHWNATGDVSPLIWLYCWHLIVIGIDLSLVLYFSRRELRHA